MKNKKLTQQEIAKKLGVKREYINSILRGKRKGSIRLTERLSELTGIPFFDLRPDLKTLLKKYL